jgi:hypothetical protein
MSTNDFEIGGRKFKLNKIDAFKQFHIVRRIAPILADLLPAMKSIQGVTKDTLSESDKLEEFAKIAAPLMTGLSKLSDEDSNRVLFGLLSSVEVQQGAGNWARVSTDSMVMIQDLELPLLLQIAGRAFMFNLSGFFAGLPQK